MALFEGSKDIVWLRNLLCKFGECQGNKPTTLLHDNQGSIAWAKEINVRKVKHIDLRYKYTNMLIAAKQIDVTYVESKENLADMLTKPLNKVLLEKSKAVLGLSH